MLRVLWRLILFGSLFFLADYGGSLLLRYGLDRYYGLAEKAPILCVGHSRMVSGIDEAMLEERTGCAVAKYAVQGTCLEDHCIMIRQYLERYPGSGKILLYIVDDYTFGKSLGKNAYRLFYPFMDAACVAGYLRRESGSWQEYTARAWLRLLRFSDTTVQSIARMGLLGRKELAEEQEVSLADLREKLAVLRLDEQRRVLPENLERFNRLVQLARSEGMTLVLLYLPFIDLLDEEGSGEASATLPIFRRYAAGDPGAVTLNQLYNILDADPIYFEPDSSVTRFYDAIIDADRINFIVGAARNAGHGDIAFRQQGIIPRQKIVELLAEKLTVEGRLIDIKMV